MNTTIFILVFAIVIVTAFLANRLHSVDMHTQDAVRNENDLM